MNTTIKALAILLGILSAIALINFIATGRSHLTKDQPIKGVEDNVFYVQVEPKKGHEPLIESLKSEKGVSEIPARADSFTIELNFAELKTSPNANAFLSIIKTLWSIFAALAFAIPFFILIDLLQTRKKGITPQSIWQIRYIGSLFILFFTFDLAKILMESSFLSSYIDLTEYTIVQPSPQYFFLLLGILVFIFAEVLKESKKMKEEQQLTI